jgi:hypothetical protein
VATNDGYQGDERRMNCQDCVSHREHANKIRNLEYRSSAFDAEAKLEHRDMWNGIKEKVPYKHFLTAVGFILTAIGIVTTVNYSTMNKVLETNHRVEIEMTKVGAEVAGLNRRMDSFSDRLAYYDREHDYFRKAITDILREKGLDNGDD